MKKTNDCTTCNNCNGNNTLKDVKKTGFIQIFN